MSYFFQLVISGVVVGSIYALSALGFVLIYKSSRVLNIAHGQIIAAGAFITYALTLRFIPSLRMIRIKRWPRRRKRFLS